MVSLETSRRKSGVFGRVNTFPVDASLIPFPYPPFLKNVRHIGDVFIGDRDLFH